MGDVEDLTSSVIELASSLHLALEELNRQRQKIERLERQIKGVKYTMSESGIY